MKDFKHTPGPWKVMISISKKGECYLSVWQGNTTNGTIGPPVCKVSPEDSATETDEANAKLIAAAPTMLEALLSIMEDNEDHNNTAYYTAKAAIEKATR